MARRVHYLTNEAYNLGYEDGQKDTIEKACGWFAKTFNNYESKSFINQLITELKQAMEE